MARMARWLVLGACAAVLMGDACEAFGMHSMGRIVLDSPSWIGTRRRVGNFLVRHGTRMMQQPQPPGSGGAKMAVKEELRGGPSDLVTTNTGAGDRPPYALNVQQKVYLWLTGLFVACLLIADVVGVKLFEIPLPFEIFGFKSVEHSCGMLTFPITFILGDIINEYYGKHAAKQTVYIGLAMSILTFGVLNLAQAVPFLDAPYNVTQDAFDMIFGSSKLLYIASLCAYTIGNLTDIWLFGIFKKLTGGKNLWLRATGSTVISQLLDSFVVTYLAFGIGKTLVGQPGATFAECMRIAATGYGLKFVLALAVTPVIYLSRDVLHSKFGLEPMPSDTADKE